MTRLSRHGARHAAMACLVVALLSQLLLPAMHALVHYAERHGGHLHAHAGQRHGARELAWVIERAGGKSAAQQQKARRLAAAAAAHGRGPSHSHSHDGAAPHSHSPAPSHEPAPLAPAPSHHHDGDQPGGPHGQSSLEHFTAFFVEATPPKLAIPFRRVAPAVVLLVEGRLAQAPVLRSQPVRGPPQLS